MVRYATLDDLSDILEMLKLCKEDMKQRGLHIWDDSYPTADLIKEDIKSGNSVVYEEDNHVLAFLVYYPNVVDHNEELYHDHKNPVLIQRVMSHPMHRRKGHAEAILRFVETLGYSSIRLLTRDVNTYSVNLYMKLGYNVITTAINGTDTMQFCEKVL
ncbi:MAG: GNAT family N-acetyltransferase [Acholeplasmatales bacterium]|nr:GNAT family N-acetyltransferase [Acholeplasmatales bacterium]